MGKKIAFGADYNPEQWPIETVAEDIDLMKQAGVTTMTVGVFSWAKLEPVEGTYDFAWLDEILDRLGDAGIEVDLATGTASPPVWMARTYPQTLPVTKKGVRLGFGSRQQYCPSSPIYRAKAAALAGAMAERYGKHPAVTMWHIGNEYGCHVSECYCEESQAAFRLWLTKKYGTIAALNDAWGTAFWSQTYASFDEVELPGQMPTLHNPQQVADASRFASDEILACFLAEKEAIRAHSDLPVTTNFMQDFTPLNYRDWVKHIDIVSDDSYPDPASAFATAQVAYDSDMARSLGNGEPFMLMEQTTGMVQWRRRNARKRPGQFFLQSLQRVAHGADGICQFQWRQSVKGAETFHSAMVPHAGTASRTWKETVRLGQALAKLDGVAGQHVKTQVAILLDWDSRWQRAASIGMIPERAGKEVRDWHSTCFEAGYQVTFVFPDQDLTGHRILIVPELFAMNEETAAKLIAAAKGGTQVVVVGPTGVVDDGAVTGGYGRYLEDLTGVRVLDHDIAAMSVERDVAEIEDITAGITVTGNRIATELAAGPDAPPTWGAMRLAGGAWAEEIITGEVKILAEFAGADLAGLPAITHKKTGFGGGTYVATDLNARSRSALFAEIRRFASMANPREGLPVGLEVAVRGNYTFLLNHGDDEVVVKGGGTDVLTDTVFKKKITVPGRDCVVLTDK